MLMTSLICRVTTESMILSRTLLRMKQDTINILLQDTRIFMEKSGCIVTDQRFSCDPSAKSQRQQSSKNEDPKMKIPHIRSRSCMAFMGKLP